MSDRCRSILLPLSGLLALFTVAAAAEAGLPEPPVLPEPLTLRQALELAVARAPELAVSFAGAEEEAASARLAEDALHPEIWVTTTPGYSRGLPGALAGRLPAIAGVEVRRSLYEPARRADALEALGRAATSRAGYEASRLGTVRSAALLYGRCWVDEALLRLADRRQGAYATILRRVEALREEGRATDLEVERARLQEARAHQVRLDLESDRDLDQLELRRLTGWPADRALVMTADPLASLPRPGPGDDRETALAADAELRSLDQAVDALDRSARLRGRLFAPVVDFAAQYSRLARYSGYDRFYKAFEADDWAVGLSVTLPLWTGHRHADALARTQANLDRLTGSRRARESELTVLLRRTESAVDRAAAKASLARRAVGVAEEELRITRVLASEGRVEASDVAARDTALADSQADEVRANGELFATRVHLLSLRGELMQALAAPSAPARPSSGR